MNEIAQWTAIVLMCCAVGWLSSVSIPTSELISRLASAIDRRKNKKPRKKRGF